MGSTAPNWKEPPTDWAALERLCEVPNEALGTTVCTIVLVDAEQAHFVSSRAPLRLPSCFSKHGEPREQSASNVTVALGTTVVVPDMAEDAVLSGLPVHTDGGMRFFASSPVRDDGGSGVVLGSVDVYGAAARSDFGQRECGVLEAVAAGVARQLAARRVRLARARTDAARRHVPPSAVDSPGRRLGAGRPGSGTRIIGSACDALPGGGVVPERSDRDREEPEQCERLADGAVTSSGQSSVGGTEAGALSTVLSTPKTNVKASKGRSSRAAEPGSPSPVPSSGDAVHESGAPATGTGTGPELDSGPEAAPSLADATAADEDKQFELTLANSLGASARAAAASRHAAPAAIAESGAMDTIVDHQVETYFRCSSNLERYWALRIFLKGSGRQVPREEECESYYDPTPLLRSAFKSLRVNTGATHEMRSPRRVR